MTYARRLARNIVKYKVAYMMLVPVVAYFVIFSYIPMYGVQIAFKDFNPRLSIEASEWVGLKHFNKFFGSIYFGRLIRNTLLLNVLNLIFGFPAPILLAPMLNEVKTRWFKKTIQTVSYLPHFISMVVMCSIIRDFVDSTGLITQLVSMITGTPAKNLLLDMNLFRPIYVVSDIWQGIGWGSIIYMAALTGINAELYEAAVLDGANRFQQIFHVTLPGILPTIMIMLILRIGNMMSLGYEKVFLLYSPAIYETADIISTYVYRKGMVDMSYSLSSAVGLFNALINLILLFGANTFARRLNGSSLW